MVREFSAVELDAACRKCLRVRVSDVGALARVLDRAQLDYDILSDDSADIFAQPVLSQLVYALDAEGCTLLSAEEHDESLESFFMSLVGGARHA